LKNGGTKIAFRMK